jgi:M6 family metalloprotease-like protein
MQFLNSLNEPCLTPYAKLMWIVVLVCQVTVGSAMEAPSKSELARYKADGSYGRRLDRCREIGNHRVRPDVAARVIHRLNAAAGRPQVNAVLPNWQGMPTTGTNDMLVFLIDFPDHAHINSLETIEDKLFGTGSSGDYPRESLTEYYKRSSYGQLTLDGNVLGWYEMAHERSWYTNQYGDGNAANVKIFEEVVDHYDATHDYSQYDNDGDGRIDYVAVIWAGPDTGWSEFWWGYQWNLYSSDLTRDGVRFYDFSWQWEARPVGGSFDPVVIIHETGHALGLPDYYDYDSSVGPDGGVGGLDMMAGNRGDHNTFSKFMLEWLTPTFVSAGSQTLTLRAAAQYPDAVTVMAGFVGDTTYDEYFLVENRHRVMNDTGFESDGLLVWHVDATPNGRGDDFEYNNSYTSHKLLRLMEADGIERIETGDGAGDAGDYYNAGETFTQSSNPNSLKYDGSSSSVNVTGISATGPSMGATFTIDSTIPVTINHTRTSIAQWAEYGSNAALQTLGIWIGGGTLSYTVTDSGPLLTVGPSEGTSSGGTNTHTINYGTVNLAPGNHETTLTITAEGAVNSPVLIPVSVHIYGTNVPESVDAPQLSWQTSSNLPWRAQRWSSHDGEDAVLSESIGNNRSTWLSTEVEGPGDMSFWWKVSSEPNYDFLHFYVDDALQLGSISGSLEWQYMSIYLGPGPHSLRWSYIKDYSVADGEDSAWLDEVGWLPDRRDTDSDGSMDWEEAIAGTIETNSMSYPQLTDISRLPVPGGVVLEWPGATGRMYSVSRASEPGGTYSQLVSRIPGVLPMNTFTDLYATVDSAFYRVGVAHADDTVVLLDESFSSNSLPSGWSVLDYEESGAVWRFNNLGSRDNRTGGEGGMAIADSDHEGYVSMETDLALPLLDFSTYSAVTLQFRSDFKVYFTDQPDELEPLASVDFQVDGGSWSNVWQRNAVNAPGPTVETLDLSAQLAGKSNVQISFYYIANYDWWWQIDDVKVLVTPAHAQLLWHNLPPPADLTQEKVTLKHPPRSAVIDRRADRRLRRSRLPPK